MNPKKVFVRDATGLVRQISSYRAFIFNVMYIWPTGMLFFLVTGQGLFPGANLIVASLLSVIPSFVLAYLYGQLSAAFPRSGGDYLFAGRILHPSIGLMINFVMVIVNIAIMGVASVWVISLGVAPTLTGLGAIMNQPSLSALAATMSIPLNEFIIAVIIAIVMPAFLFFGTDVTFKIFGAFFYIAIFSILVFIVSMFFTSRADFVTNFNLVSSTSYDQVITAATQAGVNLNYSASDTLLAIVYTMLSVWGFTFSCYVGGEVKTPQRSQVISMLASAGFYIALMTLVSAAAYVAMGHDFLAALNYLALNGNPAYTLPVSSPAFSFLAGFGTRNPTILLIGGIGILAGIFAVIIADAFWIIRCFFAWSFDRLIPIKFADVNEKYHVPSVSLIAIIIISAFFAGMAVYTPLSIYITYDITAAFVVAAIVGVAAILFPRKRNDLFSLSPPVTTRKVAGVPLISILGAATVVMGVLIAYGSLLPAISGTFNPLYISVTIVFFVIGFVMYWVAYAIQKSRGIPMDLIFKEMPPE